MAICFYCIFAFSALATTKATSRRCYYYCIDVCLFLVHFYLAIVILSLTLPSNFQFQETKTVFPQLTCCCDNSHRGKINYQRCSIAVASALIPALAIPLKMLKYLARRTVCVWIIIMCKTPKCHHNYNYHCYSAACTQELLQRHSYMAG